MNERRRISNDPFAAALRKAFADERPPMVSGSKLAGIDLRHDLWWAKSDPRYSDRARRADGRGDTGGPSHPSQLDQGRLDLFCSGRSSPALDCLWRG
jgi:hypothetical protein